MMKLNHFYNLYFYINIVFAISLILISFQVRANIENDIKDITSKLRCMTCQNQTVYSSDTEFSLTIKQIVRNKLENQETKNQIIDFLIYRYGEYIVFEPKLSTQNIFLWTFPFLILAVSLVFFIFRLKRSS